MFRNGKIVNIFSLTKGLEFKPDTEQVHCSQIGFIKFPNVQDYFEESSLHALPILLVSFGLTDRIVYNTSHRWPCIVLCQAWGGLCSTFPCLQLGSRVIININLEQEGPLVILVILFMTQTQQTVLAPTKEVTRHLSWRMESCRSLQKKNEL